MIRHCYLRVSEAHIYYIAAEYFVFCVRVAAAAVAEIVRALLDIRQISTLVFRFSSNSFH